MRKELNAALVSAFLLSACGGGVANQPEGGGAGAAPPVNQGDGVIAPQPDDTTGTMQTDTTGNTLDTTGTFETTL